MPSWLLFICAHSLSIGCIVLLLILWFLTPKFYTMDNVFLHIITYVSMTGLCVATAFFALPFLLEQENLPKEIAYGFVFGFVILSAYKAIVSLDLGIPENPITETSEDIEFDVSLNTQHDISNQLAHINFQDPTAMLQYKAIKSRLPTQG